MSEINVNEEFAKFGKKALIIAILNLVAVVVIILLLILSIFTPTQDLDYINWIIQLIIIVLIIVAATHIFKVGKALDHYELLSFRKLMIWSLILVLITTWILGFAISSGVRGSRVIPWIFVGTSLIIVLIVGIVFEIRAWGKLKRFFEEKMSKFPEDIGRKAKMGCFLNQLGSIFYLTIILAFVGFILKVIGYFILNKLNNLDLESSDSTWKGEKEKSIEPSEESLRKFKGQKLLVLGISIILNGLCWIFGFFLYYQGINMSPTMLGIFAILIGSIPTIVGILIIKHAKSE